MNGLRIDTVGRPTHPRQDAVKLGIRGKLFLLSLGIIAVAVVLLNALRLLGAAVDPRRATHQRSEVRAGLARRGLNSTSRLLPTGNLAALASDWGQRLGARVTLSPPKAGCSADSETYAERLRPTAENDAAKRPRSPTPWTRSRRGFASDRARAPGATCCSLPFALRPPAGCVSFGSRSSLSPSRGGRPTRAPQLLSGPFSRSRYRRRSECWRADCFRNLVFAAHHRARDARRSLGAHAACAATTRSAPWPKRSIVSPTACIAPVQQLGQRARPAGRHSRDDGRRGAAHRPSRAKSCSPTPHSASWWQRPGSSSARQPIEAIRSDELAGDHRLGERHAEAGHRRGRSGRHRAPAGARARGPSRRARAIRGSWR